MDLVVDSIAVGSFLEAGNAELLARHGITGLLCLAKDRMQAKPPAGVEKDSWPLVDGEGNKRSDVDGALRKLDRLLGRHARVLVHCNAGTSRSCALVAVWLARRERLTLDEALAQVAAKRPSQAVSPGLLDVLERALAGG